MHHHRVVGFWLAVVAILAIAAPAFAPPEPLNIPEELIGAQLSDSQRAQIDEHVDWWREKTLAAITNEDIIEARKGLLKEFAYSNNRLFREYFIQATIRELLPLALGNDLPADDSLREVKRINVAILLASMPDRTIQPALERLVTDENPAIRYLGWKGYSQTRPSILRGGNQPIDTFVDSMVTALKSESSPLVLVMVYDNTRFGSQIIAGINPDRITAMQKRFLQAIDESWTARRKVIASAENIQAFMSFSNGARVLGELGKALAADRDLSKTALQNLLDMAGTASKVFDTAWNAEKNLSSVEDLEEREKQSREYEKVIDASRELLLACENGIRVITNSDSTPLASALADTRNPDQGAGVRQAVFTWKDELDDRFGVVDPRPVE